MTTKQSAKAGHQDFYVEAGELMASFSRLYYRWLWAELKSIGSAPGWQTILGILEAGGPRIMSAISAEMYEAPRVITDAVDGLERRGLVQRVPHPNDRRAKVIALTPEGKTFLAASREATSRAVAGLLSDTPLHEKDELTGLLRQLLAAVQNRVSEESVPSTLELAASQDPRKHRKEHYVEVIRPL